LQPFGIIIDEGGPDPLHMGVIFTEISQFLFGVIDKGLRLFGRRLGGGGRASLCGRDGHGLGPWSTSAPQHHGGVRRRRRATR
jgi:hypothetical protein